jgi:6-phosphofructokinase 2
MNPSLDKSASANQVMPGRKLRCDHPSIEPGGGGINVSRAILRLGGKSMAYFTMGGFFGQMFTDILQQEEIEHHPFKIKENTRLNLTIFEKDSGQQYRFGMPGPEMSEHEWKNCFESIQEHIKEGNYEYFVVSGSLPRNVPSDFYRRLAHTAKDAGIKMIVDTSGDALIEVAKEGVYLLKPNMREVAQLADHEIENETQLQEVTQTIVEKGQAQVVIVSLGAAGALLVSKERVEQIKAPTVKIRSRIGAGDSMVAGLVLALASGKTLYHAACFGVAAGSAAVMTSGTELCRRKDTEQLFKQIIRKSKVDDTGVEIKNRDKVKEKI